VDGDTYGSAASSGLCCANATTPPAGYSVNNTDCDDNDNTGNTRHSHFYVDADGDGYGTGTSTVSICAAGAVAPAGYSINNTDCDDIHYISIRSDRSWLAFN